MSHLYSLILATSMVFLEANAYLVASITGILCMSARVSVLYVPN